MVRLLLIEHLLAVDGRVLQMLEYDDLRRQFYPIGIAKVRNHIRSLEIGRQLLALLTEGETELIDCGLFHDFYQLTYPLLRPSLGDVVVIAGRGCRFG